MATALASLIGNRPVRPDVAMTGEITLTGQVLPIGGLKEKALAAQRNGITTIIAPSLNEQDIEDIPAHLRADLAFAFVTQIDEVLATALEPGNGRVTAVGRRRTSRAPARRAGGRRAVKAAADGRRAGKAAAGGRGSKAAAGGRGSKAAAGGRRGGKTAAGGRRAGKSAS